MIEVKAPQPVTSLFKEPPALSNPLPSWFGEQRKTEPVHVSIPIPFPRENKPLFAVSPFPDQSHPPVGSVLAFWPEMAAAASTVVSPRGKKLRNALLIETIGRSVNTAAACAPRPTLAPAITEQAPTLTALLPTEAPTVASTATEVVDPLAGKKPEGEGVTLDSTRHQWKRVENGETQYWSQEALAWAVPHVLDGTLKGGIPLMDQPADGFNKNVVFYFDVEDGINAPFLKHPENPNSSTAPSFTRIFFTRLIERYFGKQIFQIPDTDYWNFRDDLAAGKISFTYTTSTGETKTLRLSPETGFREVYVPWEDADPVKDPRFIEWSWENRRFELATKPGTGEYRTMILGDEQGNAIIVTSSKKPLDTLSQQEVLDMLFVNIARIVLTEDQSINEFFYTVNTANVPHVVIVPAATPTPTP